MKNNSVIFTVPGEPQGKARPRVTRNGVYTPKKTKVYEYGIAQAFSQTYKGVGWFNEEPLSIKIIARFGVPKSAKKSVKDAIYHKQLLPIKKPDVDNIAKVIMDGLKDVAYSDDKQVCEITVCKDYVVEGMQPHVVVFIEELQTDRVGWYD